MKKRCPWLIMLALVVSLIAITASADDATSNWDLAVYLDEFDDPTDQWYLTIRADGSFSNSVTTKSTLQGRILVDIDNAAFVLYEYGDYRVINSTSTTVYYQIRVKDPRGDVWTLQGYLPTAGDRILLNEESKNLFLQALEQDGSFSVSITDINRATDKYVIKFNNTGFASMYSALVEMENETTKQETTTLDSTVLFGGYPQNSGNGEKEPIEWIILNLDDQKALLISKFALDCQPYNEKSTDTTWETSTIRVWLNSTFLEQAFSPEEQEKILVSQVDNSRDQGYNEWYKGLKDGQPSDNTSGGNNTEDKVYLLSCSEATRYFGAVRGTSSEHFPNDSALAWATSFAQSRSDAEHVFYMNDACEWWLRSPGSFQSYAAYVSYYGDYSSMYCTSMYYVRPVICVDRSVIGES